MDVGEYPARVAPRAPRRGSEEPRAVGEVERHVPGPILVGGLGFANNELYVTSFGTNSVVLYTAAGAFDKVLVTESGTPGPIYLSVLNVVPEPTSFALLTIGVLGLAGAGLRRARRGSRES